MKKNMITVDYLVLENFVSELFTKTGMPKEDADWYAKTVVRSNLRGIDSHGVMRVPTYFERLRCKAVNPQPQMQVEDLMPTLAVVDADDGAGCVASKKAMELAIEKAKKFGIAMVCVVNSNHFGAAAEYAQMAVDQGMMGLSMTNVPTLITAPGAKAKLVGNNPFAVGIPTYDNEHPFMLDMAMSVVAEGKLRFAASKGQPIPESWAADAEGKPTTDPEAALKGFLLPVGGFKGLGLAYVVDIICGVITNGVFADKIKSMYRNPEEPSKVGHMFTAVNLDAFVSREEMKERMTYYRDYLSKAPLVEGANPLCFPGEIEANCEKHRMSEGIPVPESTIEALKMLKETWKVEAKL